MRHALPYPLDDPNYIPEHPPVSGRVPDVVAKWGPASQLRWFRRFWDDLSHEQLQESALASFYCHSKEHLGPCCSSCISDQWDGYFDLDSCCCKAGRDD